MVLGPRLFRLSLMFVCAHPAIEASIRSPLILQTIFGFDATTIASAFLVAPATMEQRLARTKAKIRLAGIPFRAPEREDMVPPGRSSATPPPSGTTASRRSVRPTW
jgi:predicted RNA polymerase sigma factor